MKIFARPKLDIKILIIWALTAIVLVWFLSKHSALQEQFGELERKLNDDEISRVTSVYDRNKPLIFVGGVPRSGTTLMRAMLDAHPLIRCGEETRILPIMVSMRYKWLNQNDHEKERLRDAGVTQEVIDSAVGAFLLEVMLQHGQQAPNLCNKDPLMLNHMTFLKSVFPKSRFIFMVRDGRATVHSIISRKIKISGFNLNSYRECFIQWNSIIENMLSECIQVGSDSCLMVYYEQLVLHPEVNLRRIFDFLQIEWNDAVLHHEQFIGDEVSLSKTEKSTDQVIKPVNSDALSSWIGNIPNDVLADMNSIAPMLKILGYDPNANPPNYSLLDSNFLSIKN